MMIALIMVVLVIGIFLTLVVQSIPSLQALGVKYLWGKTGIPLQIFTVPIHFFRHLINIVPGPDHFGSVSFAIAIYLGEYNSSGWLSGFLKNTVELIAAVPSVIYGFWALVVIVPIVRSLEIKLGVTPYGIGIFASSVVLAIMIIPYAASLGREIDKNRSEAFKGRSLFIRCNKI